MKKSLTALMALFMPFMMNETAAQGIFSNKEYDGGRQELTSYVIGKVPMVDGLVSFSETIEVPIKKENLYARVAQWASFRFNPDTENGKWPSANYFKNTAYARVLTSDKESGTFKIQGNEDLIFTSKALVKDVAVVSYIMRISIEDGKVTATIDNIAYTYTLSDNPERIVAEDWITDDEAFTSKGKLRKVNGKFRVKTIDLKDALFDDLRNALIN